MTHPPVVYLDQKDWIDLARGYYGKSTNQLRLASQSVVEASKEGRAIFPLSITHFDETVRNLNDARRRRLAQYMITVSKGNAIIPAPVVIQAEIENACLRHLGTGGYDLKAFAVGKGLSQLVGAKADIAFNGPYKSIITEDMKRKLLDKIEGQETLLVLLEKGVDVRFLENLRKQAEDSAQIVERIRRSDSQIVDNDLRHRVAIVKYFRDYLNLRIILFLNKIGVDPHILGETFRDRKKFLRFFQSMPTSYCVFELTFYRDMQRNRKVQPNDLNDIMGLGVALPYSDVVVTERMWRTAIIQRKLDKLCKTKVLASTTELQPFLAA